MSTCLTGYCSDDFPWGHLADTYRATECLLKLVLASIEISCNYLKNNYNLGYKTQLEFIHIFPYIIKDL